MKKRDQSLLLAIVGVLGLTGLVAGRRFFQKTKTEAIAVQHLGTGVYQLSYEGEEGINPRYYGVWSADKGQDDLVVYPVAGGQAQVNVANHLGTGDYQVQLYEDVAGRFVPLAETTVPIQRQDYSLRSYYNQADPRWADKTYGDWPFWESGCLPTSMSMIYSALSGNIYTPDKVADYLYHHTSQFNQEVIGVKGNGILLASQHFGFETEVLPTTDQIGQALSEGHYVLAVLQHERFISDPDTSHALVLKGYEDGKTHLTDPWNPENTGWYSIEELFASASKDQDDLAGLGVPFVKITDA